VGRLRERGVHAIRAHIHPEHQASAAVAAAVGLVPTDHWHDGEIRWELPSARVQRRDGPEAVVS
jgi:RimJ/RimL family protein N-acetyltransferase